MLRGGEESLVRGQDVAIPKRCQDIGAGREEVLCRLGNVLATPVKTGLAALDPAPPPTWSFSRTIERLSQCLHRVLTRRHTGLMFHNLTMMRIMRLAVRTVAESFGRCTT